MLRIIIIIWGILSTISVDAQNEVIGGCVKKDGIASGINATKRFPMYSVMKFPQALYVADFLNRNNIELNTEVIVWKDDLMQDTWSPMLNTFENKTSFWPYPFNRATTMPAIFFSNTAEVRKL